MNYGITPDQIRGKNVTFDMDDYTLYENKNALECENIQSPLKKIAKLSATPVTC